VFSISIILSQFMETLKFMMLSELSLENVNVNSMPDLNPCIHMIMYIVDFPRIMVVKSFDGMQLGFIPKSYSKLEHLKTLTPPIPLTDDPLTLISNSLMASTPSLTNLNVNVWVLLEGS